MLQFWSTYNQTDSEASTIAKVIIPAFEKAHPGIKVVSDVYPTTETEMYSKLLASINAGNPPDIVRADLAWVPGLAQQGALVPLSQHMPGFAALAASVYPGTHVTQQLAGHLLRAPGRHQHPEPVLEQGRLQRRRAVRPAHDHEPSC